MIKTYLATIAHEKGLYSLKVRASSKARASLIITQVEHCSLRAIVELRKIPTTGEQFKMQG